MSKPGLFMSAMSSGLDMADMAWEMQCRQEDMRQRAIDNERRAIDDARRAVDEKAEQLKAISHQSALIAGFAMVVMVEASLTPDLHPVLLVLFGATSAATVGLMLMAMLNCTLMLVAILKYDCVNRYVPFHEVRAVMGRAPPPVVAPSLSRNAL